MIGKMRHDIVIDYSGVSTPLTVEDAYRDLQEIEMDFNDDPVKFLMWEHQWDYMLKRADIDDENSSYVYDGGNRWLWGVRVELADEASKPVAVLNLKHEITEEEAEEIRKKFRALLPKPISMQYLRDEQRKILERAKKEG